MASIVSDTVKSSKTRGDKELFDSEGRDKRNSGKLVPRSVAASRGRGSAASRPPRGRGRGKLAKRGDGSRRPHVGLLKYGIEGSDRPRSRSHSREKSQTRARSSSAGQSGIGDGTSQTQHDGSSAQYSTTYMADLDLPEPQSPKAFRSELGFHFQFEFPCVYCGLLIGKHGIFAKKMLKQLNVQLTVRTVDGSGLHSYQWVTLLGSVSGVKDAMDDIVKRFPKATLPIITDEQVEYYKQLKKESANSPNQNIRITVGNERYEGPSGDYSPGHVQYELSNKETSQPRSNIIDRYDHETSLDAMSRKPPPVARNSSPYDDKRQRHSLERPQESFESRWDSPRRYSTRDSPQHGYPQDSQRYSPRRDSPRRDTLRRDSLRRYSPRRYSPQRDSLRMGSPRRDSPRRGSPRRDSPRRGSPRRGSPRRGSPRRGSPRRGSPRRGSPRRDSPRRDSPRRGSPKRYSPRGDSQRRDSLQTEFTRRDFTQRDSPRRDILRKDSPRRDSPEQNFPRQHHHESPWQAQEGCLSPRQQNRDIAESDYETRRGTSDWDYSKWESLNQQPKSLKRYRSKTPDNAEYERRSEREDGQQPQQPQQPQSSQQKRSHLADLADIFKNRPRDDLPVDPYIPIQEARTVANRINEALRHEEQQQSKPLPGLDSLANVDDEDRYLYGDDMPLTTPQPAAKPSAPTDSGLKKASSLVPDYDLDEDVDSTAKRDAQKSDEPYDPTIENILKSIGFNFKMSKQMQEKAQQARGDIVKKKVDDKDESVEGYGIDRASSFLSTGLKDVDIGTVLTGSEKDVKDVVKKSGGRPASVQREESYEDRAKRYRAEQRQAHAMGCESPPPFDAGRRVESHRAESPKQERNASKRDAYKEDAGYSVKQGWHRDASPTSTSRSRYVDASPSSKQGQYKEDKPLSKYREASPVQKQRQFKEASPVPKRGQYKDVSPKRDHYRDASPPSSRGSDARYRSPSLRHGNRDISPRHTRDSSPLIPDYKGDSPDSRNARLKSPVQHRVEKVQRRSVDSRSDRRSPVSRRSRSWSPRSRDRSLSPKRRSPKRRSPSPQRRGRTPPHRRHTPPRRGHSPLRRDRSSIRKTSSPMRVDPGPQHPEINPAYQAAKHDDPLVYSQPPQAIIPPPPVHLPPPGYPVPPPFYDWNYAYPPPPSVATASTFYGQQAQYGHQQQEWPAAEVNRSNLKVLKEADCSAPVSTQPADDDTAAQLSRLETELTDLQRQQNEMMRRKQRERDGHRDPLIADNAALQHDIYQQIAVLHRKNNHHVLADAAMEKAKELQVNKNQKAADTSREAIQKPPVEKNANYEYFDPGNHWCPCCNHVAGNIFELFVHLLSKKHQQNVDPYNRPWVNDFPKTKKEKLPNSQTVVAPMKGIEFLMATQAFYCRLCSKFVGDAACAEQHLKADDHNNKYAEYIKDNTFYERRFNLDRAAGLSRMRSEPEEKEVAKAPKSPPRVKRRSPSPVQKMKRRESIESKKEQERRREPSGGTKRKTTEGDEYKEKRPCRDTDEIKKEKRSVMVEQKRRTSEQVFEDVKVERDNSDKVRPKEKQAISIKLLGRSQGKVIGLAPLEEKQVKVAKTPPAVQSGPLFPLRKKTQSGWRMADSKAQNAATASSGTKPIRISMSDRTAVASAAIASAFAHESAAANDSKKPDIRRKFKDDLRVDMFSPIAHKKEVTPLKAAIAAGKVVSTMLAKSTAPPSAKTTAKATPPSAKTTAKVQSKPAPVTSTKKTAQVADREKAGVTAKVVSKETGKQEASSGNMSKPDVKRDVLVESDDDAKSDRSDVSMNVGSDFEVLDECDAD